MEAILNSKKKNGGFDFEFIDYQDTNNDFLVEKVDFNDVKNPNVIPIEEMDKKIEENYISNKTEYIELDETLLNSDIRNNYNKLNKSNPVIDSIEFDGLKWRYIINYHELGTSKTEYHWIEKRTFYENESKKKQKLAKTNIMGRKLKKLDMNLYSTLRLFDKKHGTSKADDYLYDKDNYSIKYDIRKIFRSKEYTFGEKLGFIKTANKQKKQKKVEVENPKGLRAVPTLAGLALMFGVFSIIPNSGKPKVTTVDNDKKIVSDNDEVSSNESVVDELINNGIKDTTREEEIIVNKQEDNKEEVKPSKNLVVNFSINDKIVLNNVDLEYSPIEDVRHINTDDLEYVESYKMSRVCAYEGNTILYNEKVDNMDNESLDDLIFKLHNQYGDNIKIFANFNGYDKNDEQVLENIGWSDIEKLNVKDVSFKKEQINKLKKAKETLLSLTTDNSRTTSYQKIK